MNSTILQIFLLVNVFVIGFLSSSAIRHAVAHFHPQPHPEESHPQPRSTRSDRLPYSVRKKLLKESQTNFETVLQRSSAELQHDLSITVDHLNKQLAKLGVEILGDELKRYRATIDGLRKQAENDIETTKTEIAKHQAEIDAALAEKRAGMEAKMNEEIAAEKEELKAQLDTKLADAVSSFLVETLGHNADLGAQSDYLMSMLEEHKAEIIKEIQDEA